jgi:4-pyridoxolactonase
MSVKVYLLDSGTLVIDRSQILWNIDCGTPVRFPVYSALVEHPEGLFLFDTGYDLDHVERVLPFEQPVQDSSQTIQEQLKLCGIEPGDVDYVINSHLHFDHVGGNRFLTNATTLLHKKELRHGKVPEPFERLGYSDLTFDHEHVSYDLLEGDIKLADGLWLYETPGHTAGHYSLYVELESDRSMIFAGDACYTHENLEKEIIGGFHLNPVDAVRSIKRLKQLSKELDAEVMVSHDPEAFSNYKLAPQHYGG